MSVSADASQWGFSDPDTQIAKYLCPLLVDNRFASASRGGVALIRLVNRLLRAQGGWPDGDDLVITEVSTADRNPIWLIGFRGIYLAYQLNLHDQQYEVSFCGQH